MVGNRLFLLILVYSVICTGDTSHNHDTLSIREEDKSSDDKGVSLLFVIDATASMSNDIKKAKEGALKIFDTMRKQSSEPIYNFILVQFRDPLVSLLANTRNETVFKQQLDGIITSGGGDCPEMTLGGIKRGLELARPESYVFVFTDATAKDYSRADEVLHLVQVKNMKVSFVMTGDCNKAHSRGYTVYNEIADVGSGQVYRVEKMDVDKVLELMISSIRHTGNKVNLIPPDAINGNPTEKNISIPVDKYLTEFTVVVSGTKAKLSLTAPSNLQPNASVITNLVDLKNVKAVLVEKPQTGKWILRVSSVSRFSLRLSGISDTNFFYGFSSQPTTNTNATTLRPVRGGLTNLLIWPINSESIKTIYEVVLTGSNGTVYQRLPLKSISTEEGFIYTTNSFIPPDRYFHITIYGTSTDGTTFMRSTPTAVAPVEPEEAEVTVETEKKEFLSTEPASVQCKVKSLLPFDVQWLKNGQKIGELQHFAQTADVTFNFGRISEADAGVYTCKVNNSVGYTKRKIKVVVKATKPVIDRISTNVTEITGKHIEFVCRATGFPKPKITWQFRSNQLPEKQISASGSLSLENITINDEGSYTCTAENYVGSDKSSTSLTVLDPPEITFWPTHVSAIESQLIELNCNAIGKPQPYIKWLNHKTSMKSTERSASGKFRFTARQEDSGNYSCYAFNSGGSDVKYTSLSIVVPPRILNNSKQTMKVIEGSDIILECIAYGFPIPKITWNKLNYEDHAILISRQIYGADKNGLTIKNATTNSSGSYVCNAENSGGIAQKVYDIEILVKPYFLGDYPSVINLTVDDDYLLPCNATGHPQPTLKWYKDGKETNNNEILNIVDNNLILTYVTLETSGIYSCVASNPAGIASRNHTFYVRDTNYLTPMTSLLFERKEAFESQTATLTCPTSSSNHIVWLKDGLRFGQRGDSSRFEYFDNGKILEINDIDENDNGVYSCSLESGKEKSRIHSFDLIVLTLPKFIYQYSVTNFTINEGEYFFVDCSATGNPHPKVKWQFSDFSESARFIPLSPYTTQEIVLENSNQNIKIHFAKSYHSGNYKCIAFNSNYEASRTISLTVNGPPKIEGLSEEKIDLVLGQSYNLLCNIKGIPVPEYSWTYDDWRNVKREELKGIPVNKNSPLQYYEILELKNVTMSNNGTYSCTAANKVGFSTKKFQVIILAPPIIENANIIEDIIIINLNENQNLTCAVTGWPEPAVIWLRNGVIVKKYNGTEVNKYSMELLAVPGIYSCRASNKAGIAEKYYNVTVIA